MEIKTDTPNEFEEVELEGDLGTLGVFYELLILLTISRKPLTHLNVLSVIQLRKTIWNKENHK